MRSYEFILEAKKFVEDQIRNGGFEHIDRLAGRSDADHAALMGAVIKRAQEKCGINSAAALATVLCCGEFIGWQRNFIMPLDATCEGAFREIRKDLKKGRPLSLAYIAGNYEDPVLHGALGPGPAGQQALKYCRLSRR